MRDPSLKYRCRNHTPPDRMKTPDPDLSQAASQSRKGTNAQGPRHIRRWTPPHSRRLEETPLAGASPRPPQHSTSQIRFRSRHQDRGGVAPLPRASKEQPCPNRRPHHLVAPPAQKTPAALPTSQGSRLRRLPTMYHTGVVQRS